MLGRYVGTRQFDLGFGTVQAPGSRRPRFELIDEALGSVISPNVYSLLT